MIMRINNLYNKFSKNVFKNLGRVLQIIVSKIIT